MMETMIYLHTLIQSKEHSCRRTPPLTGGGGLWHLMFFILSICLFISSAHAGAPGSGPEYAQVHITPSVTTIAPGDDFTVYIDQKIVPDWHTYWKNPGDSGTPTLVTWELPEGVMASDLEYPTPARIPFGPLTNFGYETRAVFTQKISIPRDFTGDTLIAKAKIEWLVCHDICIPEYDTKIITVPISKVSTQNSNARDLADLVSKTHPVRVEFGGIFYERDGYFQIAAIVNHPDFMHASPQNLDLINATFFPIEWGLIDNTASQEIRYDGSEDPKNLPLVIQVKRGDRSLDQVKEFRVVLSIPDIDGVAHGYDMFVKPGLITDFDLTGSLRRISEEMFSNVQISNRSSIQEASLVGNDMGDRKNSSISFWFMILGAFLAGLILNLMPCVLPVLFIKILAVAKLSGAERAHARAHGLMYAGGVISTFLTLAGILVVMQSLGASVGWGFQLQSPLVVAALTALFIGLTLNLWGVFDIDLTRFIPAFLQRVEDRTHWNSFLTGILAVFVATPCTVPFMGAAVAYGLTQGPIMTIAVFTAMGIGLSAPFVVLTFVPAFMRVLPKPGAWMMTFRRICAVPMVLTALWLGSVLAIQTGVLPTSLSTEHQNESAIPYTPLVLDQALQSDRPVFVNMTAAWCITCKYNERIALNTDQTRAVFAKNDVQMVVGDWTNYNADITVYLNQFDRKGVPIYVFYGRPDPRTGVRPDPVLLPSLLNEKILYDLFIHEIGEKK